MADISSIQTILQILGVALLGFMCTDLCVLAYRMDKNKKEFQEKGIFIKSIGDGIIFISFICGIVMIVISIMFFMENIVYGLIYSLCCAFLFLFYSKLPLKSIKSFTSGYKWFLLTFDKFYLNLISPSSLFLYAILLYLIAQFFR
jgi:hypothetical protein